MAGEEEEQAQDHHRGEDEPGGDLKDEGAGARIADGRTDQPAAGGGAGRFDDDPGGLHAAATRQGLAGIGDARAGTVAPVAEDQAGHTGGGDQQDGDLAEGVPRADIDQCHVDGVGAVADAVGEVGEHLGYSRVLAGVDGVRADDHHEQTHADAQPGAGATEPVGQGHLGGHRA